MNEDIYTKRYVFLTQNGRGGIVARFGTYHHLSLIAVHRRSALHKISIASPTELATPTNPPSSRAGGRRTCSGDLPPGTVRILSYIPSRFCVAVVLPDVFGEGDERVVSANAVSTYAAQAHTSAITMGRCQSIDLASSL